MLLENISHGRRSALITIKDPEVGHCSSFRSAHRCFVPIPQPETGMFQDVTLQQAAFCFSILNTRIFRLHTHAAARLYIAITAPDKLPEIPRPAEFRARRGTGAGAERAEHTLPDAEWRGTGPSQGGAECADPVADQNAIRKSSIIRSLALRAIEGTTTDHILIYIDSGDDSLEGNMLVTKPCAHPNLFNL